MVSTPLDLGFTTFVGYPAIPNTPGAADINRWQNDIVWLANPPSASLHYTNTAIIDSSFAYAPLLWNNIVEQNTTGMIAASTTLTHPTDRILFKYPGKYRCTLRMRTQYNLTSGLAQAQLIYTDSGGDEVLDGAEADCHATNPRWLKCEFDAEISAGDITNGASIRAQYVQDSGSVATVQTSPLSAYPRLTVTWIGNNT